MNLNGNLKKKKQNAFFLLCALKTENLFFHSMQVNRNTYFSILRNSSGIPIFHTMHVKRNTYFSYYARKTVLYTYFPYYMHVKQYTYFSILQYARQVEYLFSIWWI